MQPAMSPSFGDENTSFTSARPTIFLANLRREHAAHGRLHVVDRLVDDAVVADVDAGLLDRRSARGIGTNVEADNDGVRGGRQRRVGLGDTADAGADDLDLHFVVRQLLQRIPQRLGTAVHVGLDHQRDDLRCLAFGHLAEHVLELRRLLLRELRRRGFALAELATSRALRSFLTTRKSSPGARRLGQAKHDGRGRRSGLLIVVPTRRTCCGRGRIPRRR